MRICPLCRSLKRRWDLQITRNDRLANACLQKKRGGNSIIAATISRPLCGARSRIFSLRRQYVSEPLPRLRSLAAQAAEVPLLPDPAIVVSEERCVRPEIRAHHGA